jgi:hypothetical protein
VLAEEGDGQDELDVAWERASGLLRTIEFAD